MKAAVLIPIAWAPEDERYVHWEWFKTKERAEWSIINTIAEDLLLPDDEWAEPKRREKLREAVEKVAPGLTTEALGTYLHRDSALWSVRFGLAKDLCRLAAGFDFVITEVELGDDYEFVLDEFTIHGHGEIKRKE